MDRQITQLAQTALLICSVTIVSVVSGPRITNADGCVFQRSELLASDRAEADLLGIAVAISGQRAVVGAHRDDDRGTDSGSVYVFNVVNGQQIRKLTANDGAAFDHFGFAVAVWGEIALIGAYGDDDMGIDAGSAYLFNISTGQQLFKLNASDASNGRQFGYSVAITDEFAVVGSPEGLGAAYVFDLDNGQQIRKLTALDGVGGDRFAFSVSASRSLALVGAPNDDDRGLESGSAYLFNLTSGQQLRKFVALDGSPDDRFGFSVAISTEFLVIGAPRDDDHGADSGSAFVFSISSGNQLYKLVAADAAAGDAFGKSVAVNGVVAIVGAPAKDEGASNSGAAYRFDALTGQQQGKLVPNDANALDAFSDAVAVDNNNVLIGSPYNDTVHTNTGSAYLFEAPLGLDSDFDGDCFVTLADFAIFAACFAGEGVTIAPPGCSPPGFTLCDLDGDYDVDLSDFSTFSTMFGT